MIIDINIYTDFFIAYFSIAGEENPLFRFGLTMRKKEEERAEKRIILS